MKNVWLSAAASCFLGACLTGCASVDSRLVLLDGGNDAGADAGHDGGIDGGIDGGHDAGVDAGKDAGAPDAGHDGGVPDAGHDGGIADAGHDGGVADGGNDAGVFDAGPPRVGACDALPDAGIWQEISPPGVTISGALAQDPFNIGTLWLGTDPTTGAGGLFNSTNCGSTWTHVNNGVNGSMLDMGRIWSLVVDPVQEGVIYAVDAYGPNGLFKSSNGGVDWVQLFPSTSQLAQVLQYDFVSSVSMDPTDHNHLVVGTHGDCAAPYAPVCQAETTNGGSSWKIVTIPNPIGTWVERSGVYVVNETSWLYTTFADGIYLTTDHGATFSNITPSGVIGAAGGEFTHRPLKPSPAGNYYLPSVETSGLLVSTDGKSWTLEPGSPGGIELCLAVGGGKVYMADFQGGNFRFASETDLTQWTQFAPPFTVSASQQGPIFLEYDADHHLLYSSDFTGGVWRIVMP